MRRNSYKKNIIFIFVLLFVISCISISYALLNTSLNTSYGTTTQKKLTFNVGFATSQVTGRAVDNYNSECGTITPTLNTVTYDTQIFPDSRCVYKLKIRNIGTTAAQLDKIININPSGGTCSNYSDGSFSCINNGARVYFYLYDESTLTNLLSDGWKLEPSEYKDVYFVVDALDEGASNYSSYTFTGGGFKLSFKLY